MSTLIPAETALLLIDVQKAFDHPTFWGTSRSTPRFEENIATLLKAFREARALIYHVRHHSVFESSILHPSKESADFMPYATPRDGEPVFTKSVNSAFIGTDLEQAIRRRSVKNLVIVGLTTPHCVSTTTRMASNLDVIRHKYHRTPELDESDIGSLILVNDATAMWGAEVGGKAYNGETLHAIHLASLQGEFCDVENTEDVIQRLQRSR